MKENQWDKERALLQQQLEQLQERMDNMHSRESTLRANQRSLTQFIEDLKIIGDGKDKNLSVSAGEYSYRHNLDY